MGKGNLFLGYGRGKAGDLVFSRQNGEQVFRARNRSPRNPQTPLTMLQRVVMKTCSSAFSVMQDICNHSFEGVNGVTDNQARFCQVNIARMRQDLEFEINSGDPEDIMASSANNYLARYMKGCAYYPFIIAEGTLQIPLSVTINDSGIFFTTEGTLGISDDKADITYGQLIEAIGCNRGDQITFISFAINDTATDAESVFNQFKYARIIMEPANGDLTTKFWNGDAINSPNPRNEGDAVIDFRVGLLWSFPTITPTKANANSLAAGAVIISREEAGVWKRTPSSLVLRPYTVGTSGALQEDHGELYLSDAIASYLAGDNSSLYLNQAE